MTQAEAPGKRDEDKGQPSKGGGLAQASKKVGGFRLQIGAALILLLIGGGAYYWISSRNVESTDDAFTDGRAIAIAPQVAGQVDTLSVRDNQFVRKGDPLIRINQRQFLIDRDSAKGALDTAKAQYQGFRYGAEIARKNFPAQLAQAQAQLANAQAVEARAAADYQRQKSLPAKATTQQEIDAAAAALKQAKAQVALADAQVLQNQPVPQRIGEADTQVGQLEGQVQSAQARLDQANLNLAWTNVTAPQDGWVTKRNVEAGNYVTAGQQVMSIVSPEVWVTANFKENQLKRMRPGQKVDIEVDGYPQLKLKGHVDSIQLGAGSKFTAFPPENATGNFVKIVQRVPVKIVIDSGLDPEVPLPLGISVTPKVFLK
ncbi:HlyD family secretion protein [Methylocystis bryophila]|uniref:HlyD family secretion protein n=1 Tax=Methylocystis bryophila TaxID=655015 RepID=UPI000A26E671|nr:HlyD family secretion protein [Methylocystis bryophila]BDV40826.1 multidrug export protein EmrA [Methylocystis bryophila]